MTFHNLARGKMEANLIAFQAGTGGVLLRAGTKVTVGQIDVLCEELEYLHMIRSSGFRVMDDEKNRIAELLRTRARDLLKKNAAEAEFAAAQILVLAEQL